MSKRKYVAVLLDTRDGTKKEYADEWRYDDDGLLFYWTDGNFGCDCNRSIVMYNYDETKELNCNTGIEENIIQLLSLKIDGVELLEEAIA